MNTPQTDRLHEARQADDVFSAYYLMVNLSRQMEHKLAEVQEERDKLVKMLSDVVNQEHGAFVKAGILLRSLTTEKGGSHV